VRRGIGVLDLLVIVGVIALLVYLVRLDWPKAPVPVAPVPAAS
jgi:hypothetical protein